MANQEEVKKLAALARISISDAELEKFTKEFDSILAYVGQLESLDLGTGKQEAAALHNVMRADGEPHAPGAYTEKLAKQFPAQDEGYLEVKQIISYE